MSENIQINTTYNLDRTIEGSIDALDISEQIHEAALEGVRDCGGYDVDIEGGYDDSVDVHLSGTVSVTIDTDYLISTDLEDTHDIDPFDATVEDIDITGGWRNNTTVDITYTARVEREVEHEAEVRPADLAISLRRILKCINYARNNYSHDSFLFGAANEANVELEDLVRTFVGQEWLDAFMDEEV